jgi:uncharacterized protein YecT (DUF1311 family)
MRSSLRTLLPRIKLSTAVAFAAFFLAGAGALPLSAVAQEPSNAPATAPPQNSSAAGQDAQSPDPQNQDQQTPAPKYDVAIFQNRIPSDQLAFLNQFVRSDSGDLIRDKQYKKIMKHVVPNCIYHYGRDMSLPDAYDMVLSGSRQPVQIRDGRYVMVSGKSGPYLMGRGFMWIDMQDGIALGGFYFRPINGEPTPTVTIFSQQVKERTLQLSQLPAAFAEDLSAWSSSMNIPPVTTRYFITDRNEKILLEHTEDYCSTADPLSSPVAEDCEQMNADASDLDMNAAYYLDQTNHATNATAWMIVGDDQVAWIRVRDTTCSVGPDPLICHIRLTRQRTHRLISNPQQHPHI